MYHFSNKRNKTTDDREKRNKMAPSRERPRSDRKERRGGAVIK